MTARSADLATPESSSSGVLDAMGAAHLLGLTDNDLARLGPHFPLATAGGGAARVLRRARATGRVFTAVNPSYDPSGRSLARYVDTVAGALAAGLTGG